MPALLGTARLVGSGVLYRDIRLGVVVDVLLDRALRRVVGLDVRCGDGNHRFLPFPASHLREDGFTVDSALVFLERDLDFYRLGGRTFSELSGTPVLVEGTAVGDVVDLLVDEDGRVRRVVVAGAGGRREVEPGPRVTVGSFALESPV